MPADFSRAAQPDAPVVSPGEARAAAQGIDAGDAAALDAQVAQLAADGRLPPDLLGEYRAAVEADARARAQHAADAW